MAVPQKNKRAPKSKVSKSNKSTINNRPQAVGETTDYKWGSETA